MDARHLLGKLTDSPAATGLAGGLMGGGLIVALMSRHGYGTTDNPAQPGGIAALGGLAYHAWRRYKRHQQPVNEVGGAHSVVILDAVQARFVPSAVRTDEHLRLSRNLLQAMVSAARVDGAVNDAEWVRVDQQMKNLDLDDEDRALLVSWMRQPVDIARLARLARNIEEASELYLATLLTIDVDHWGDTAYIEDLRQELDIDPDLATELEKAAASDLSPVAA